MTISMENMTTHKKRTMLKGIKLENNDNQSANKKKKKTEKKPRQVQNMDYAVRLFFFLSKCTQFIICKTK